MELKAGARFRSAVSDVEVIVIRASGDEAVLTCGGVPVLDSGDSSPKVAPEAGQDDAILLGKRYVDDSDTLEVLCTKPGEGTLAVDGRPLQLKSAKPLPSSD
jgi:hypothetical protein